MVDQPTGTARTVRIWANGQFVAATQYHYAFSDGGEAYTSSSTPIYHTFKKPGRYSVSLRVNSDAYSASYFGTKTNAVTVEASTGIPAYLPPQGPYSNTQQLFITQTGLTVDSTIPLSLLME